MAAKPGTASGKSAPGILEPLETLGYISTWGPHKYQELEGHRGGADTNKGTWDKRSWVRTPVHRARQNCVRREKNRLIQQGPQGWCRVLAAFLGLLVGQDLYEVRKALAVSEIGTYREFIKWEQPRGDGKKAELRKRSVWVTWGQMLLDLWWAGVPKERMIKGQIVSREMLSGFKAWGTIYRRRPWPYNAINTIK